MPVSGKKEVAQSIFPYISLLGFAALWFSPFVVSLVTAILGLFTLIFIPKKIAGYHKWVLYGSYLILLLSLLDFLFDKSDGTAGAKFLLILGMVFVLRSHFYFLKGISTSKLLQYFTVICLIVTAINVISISGYYLNQEYYDMMLLQSKSIPIPNMHHIHFGVINAFVIISIAGVLTTRNITKYHRYLLAVLGIICLYSFHVLSSRTGLLAFYSGCLITLFIYVFQNKVYKVLWVGLIGLVVVAYSGFKLSSSLQSKVTNSVEDVNSWGQGEEINHKSMAMRLEAYKTSAAVLFKHPLGVGASGQDSALQAMYVEQNTLLFEENRVGPHNQVLEFGVKYGWVGIFAILLFLIGWCKLLPHTSAFFWGALTIFVVALQFESLLERQSSIYFTMLLLPLFYHLFLKPQLIE